MPTQEHELYADQFREHPELAPEMLQQVAGLKIPPDLEASLGSPDLTQTVPTEYRADVVIKLTGPAGDMAVVVEIQRAPDDGKRWSWPAYLATLRSRLKQPTHLLVVCPDERTARWSREPIAMGHPGWELTPAVIGPSELGPITDPDRIAQYPKLTVLAGIGHPGNDQAIQSIHDAVETLGEKEMESAKMYLDYALDMLPEAARKRLEELMTTSTYEYKSDFARGYFDDGEAKGKAESVLDLLDLRHIEVPDEARDRILGCTDLPQIKVWLERALTAQSIDELFQ